jgi:hypothetical protein
MANQFDVTIERSVVGNSATVEALSDLEPAIINLLLFTRQIERLAQFEICAAEAWKRAATTPVSTNGASGPWQSLKAKKSRFDTH